MSLFELVAKLTLDSSEYESALGAARSSAEKSGNSMQKSMDRANRGITGAALGMGGAVLALGTMSVNTGKEFDSSMSQVAATMGYTVDQLNDSTSEEAQNFQKLRDYAQEMGKSTSFSATQVADALNYMALAGYDAETSMDMLPNVLNLAAAGGIDLASASDMVTDAQSALGLSLDETAELVDKMAMASSKSNTSVAQLGDAILTVGGTAKNLSGGTTELSTALGILADNGIKGAEGGTALRNIILSLSAPTDQAAALMKELGLEVYDADGNMRPLNDTFNDLNSILGGMTQAEQTEVLNTLFNKVDLKSANALLANSGERFDELSGYIDEAQGSAQAMADTQLDNLDGDITHLKSAFEGLQIQISDKLTPYLRTFVQLLTGFITNIDQYLPIIIALATAFGTLAVALNMKKMIDSVTTSVKGLFLLLSANPIAVVVAAIAGLVAWFVYMYKTNEEFRQKVQQVWATVKEVWDKISAKIIEAFKKAWAYLGPVLQTLKETFDKVFRKVYEIVSAAFEKIQAIIGFIMPIVQGIVEVGFEKIRKFIEDPIGTARDTVDSVVKAIAGFLEFTGLKDSVSEIWNDIKSKITQPISDAKKTVGEIVEKIKGFFPLSVGKIFSNIKLPHFSVSGKPPFGIGGLGEKPSISVSWYKKAGEEPYMFTNATLFGAGEAGDEILYGRNALMNDIKGAIEDTDKTSGDTIVNIYNTINGADDSEEWMRAFVRQMLLEARMA